MVDVVDKKTRSRMMAGIRGKNTKPELSLRRALYARGFRYRLHARNVTGKPDIVLPRYKAVIFVNGCFWHRHNKCRFATNPSTRPEFWQAKFTSNVSRDAVVRATLMHSGWRVATVWECALQNEGFVAAATDQLEVWLRAGISQIEIGEVDVQSVLRHKPSSKFAR